jgi:alpha-D-ribose 1-methylphosphonate 5-triphosphate synthase subunit PhnI
LDAAIAQHPQLLSLNGGGNDLMRPRVSIAQVATQLDAAVDRAVADGTYVILASGANPSLACPATG